MPQHRDGRLPPTYFCRECHQPFSAQIDLMKHEGSCHQRLRPMTTDDGWHVIPAPTEAERSRSRDDLVRLLEELA